MGQKLVPFWSLGALPSRLLKTPNLLQGVAFKERNGFLWVRQALANSSLIVYTRSMMAIPESFPKNFAQPCDSVSEGRGERIWFRVET